MNSPRKEKWSFAAERIKVPRVPFGDPGAPHARAKGGKGGEGERGEGGGGVSCLGYLRVGALWGVYTL